jgi:hypothetical protein
MAKKQITLAPTSTIFYDDQTKVLLTDHDVVEIDVPIGTQTQIALNSGHLLIVKEAAAAEPTGNAEKANKQAGAGTGTGADKPTETPPTEPHSGEPPPDPPAQETPKGSAGKGK